MQPHNYSMQFVDISDACHVRRLRTQLTLNKHTTTKTQLRIS